LQTLQIATPRPIAIVEKRWGPFRQQAYFIYGFVAGTISSDIFTTRSTEQKDLAPAAEKIILLIKQMQDAKLSHGDLKTANFVFCDDKVFIIDLDAMQKHWLPFLHQRAKKKDIQRFLANWPDDIAVQSLMRAMVEKLL
jgi:hypothetical protein